MSLPDLYNGKAPPSGALQTAIGADFTSGEEERLTFRHFFSILRRRFRLFIAILAAVFGLGVLITLLQPRTYEANALVLLKSNGRQLEEKVTDRTEKQDMEGDADVSTEIQVIGSLDLARRVVQSENLITNPEVNPLLAPKQSLIDKITGTEPRALKIALLTPAQKADLEEKLARNVRAGLGALRVGTAYTVAITYRHSDPATAKLLANAYAREYEMAQVNDKRDATSQATKFLARKVQELRHEATQDFAAVQRYRVANNLLSNSATALTEQDISVYNQQVATARAEAAADTARLATAKKQLLHGSAGDDVGEALSSTVVSALRTQRAQIGARVADYSVRYGPRHPDLLRAKEELASVDRQIQEEIDRVLSNLEAKAAVSSQRLASLSGTLGSARGELARNNSALVSLDDLQRRAEASQGLYESYLARYRQLAAGSGTEQSQARVLSEASTPLFPSSPKIFLNLALALICGSVLGVVIALAVEMQFKGLTTAEDVERRTGLPYLGLTLDNKSLATREETPMETLRQHPNSLLAEAVRAIHAATHIPAASRGAVIAITSALPGEGKTTLCAMLGETAASLGSRTILVDCDVILRGLTHFYGLHGGKGLREVVQGKINVAEAIHFQHGNKPAILPITTVADPGERLTGNGGIQAIIAQLREQFDLILLDCPPLLTIAEAREIASLSDGAVLATRWRSTPDDAVKSAARLLPSRLADYSGVVLSCVDLRRQQKFARGRSGSYMTTYDRYAGANA